MNFSKKGKQVINDLGQAFKSLDLSDIKGNIGNYHEAHGNFMIGKGRIFSWLYDNSEALQKLSGNEYDLVMFAPGRSIAMAFQSSPLQDIWKPGKRRGHKELMALLDGWLFEDEDGQKKLRICMMSTRTSYKGNGLMKALIASLVEANPDHALEFEDLTEQGHFFASKAFPEANHVWTAGCTWRPKGYVEKAPTYKILQAA